MQEMVMLSDALKEMDKGEPFDISYWTADKARNTGGKVIELKNVIQTSKFKKHAIRKVELQNGQFKDIHIFLMRTFNNKRICI